MGISVEEIERMVILVKAGVPIEEIASKMGYSEKAIRNNVRPHIKGKKAPKKDIETKPKRKTKQKFTKILPVITLPSERENHRKQKNITFPIRYSINKKTKVVHFTSSTIKNNRPNQYKSFCGIDLESTNLITTDIDIIKICENDSVCKLCKKELAINRMYTFIDKIYELFDELT